MGRAVAPAVLEPVEEPSVVQARESLRRDRRAGQAPTQALEPATIPGRDSDVGVQAHPARARAALAFERRGAFLAARHGIRPGEIRALELGDVQRRDDVSGSSISRAVKDPNANAPTGGTKTGEAHWIPVQEELDGWISNALREEWNRAASTVGLEVRMYEGTKHSAATGWRSSGMGLEMIQRMLRHRDCRSTERYAKLADQALVVAFSKARKP